MTSDFVKKLLSNLIRTPSLWGKETRLHVGLNCSLNDTLFNTMSGEIFIGDNTIFGHRCMVLTGRHIFFNGKRASLSDKKEVPKKGFDIKIGSGCWIASGSIICGGVSIGDNCIIGAGSVVTKSIPSGKVAFGNPAKIVKDS